SGLDQRLGMNEGWLDIHDLNDSQAGTDRLLFSWAALAPNGPSSFQPDLYLPTEKLDADRAAGRELVGMIQFTPGWAARDPGQGELSVPRGLGDPNGPWS